MNENAVTPWEERLAQEAKEQAALERPSLSMISLRSGIMSLNGTAIPGNKLPCVVVASAFENQYFNKPFDPNIKENPLCFALSADGVDMVPHDNSGEKQGEACITCSMSQWGSDPKGGKGKACKQKRRLALLPAAALKDGNVASAEMAVMTIPVTSARNWANYVNRLASEFARPPYGVLTEISVKPNPKTQFEVNFEPVGVVATDFLQEVHARINPALAVLLAPYEVAAPPSEEGERPTPKSGKKKY